MSFKLLYLPSPDTLATHKYWPLLPSSRIRQFWEGVNGKHFSSVAHLDGGVLVPSVVTGQKRL